MNRTLLALALLVAASATLAPPAQACAMYIPPARTEAALGVPVQAPNASPTPEAVQVPTETELQRAMALIDAVGLIPEASTAPAIEPVPAAEPPVPAAAPEPTLGIARTSPPMAVAPAR